LFGAIEEALKIIELPLKPCLIRGAPTEMAA
jgi:hypothetical protein